mmetsp:Transcript_15165/g.26461  ORF Transcript_15165/g.26461 Transcript_15165/m.26461 type:complete len:785 (-) Transcript_15165:106-2460(-)
MDPVQPAKRYKRRISTMIPLLLLLTLTLAGSLIHSKSVDAKPSEVAKPETFGFQAEVSRLMDIIIHSLYSNRDVFLRELISNAADALDKIRFLSITNPSILGTQKDLYIKIRFDKENKYVEVIDTGIGMSREELITNLGSVAKSGTSAFLDKIKASSDTKDAPTDYSNLIGQFGVGFYSAFLVADMVTVTSKSNDDPKQWVWQSTADSSFTIMEDKSPEKLVRGTKVHLHMKEDAMSYVSEETLTNLVKKYSQFINFPIYLEVPVEREEKKDEAVDLDEEESKEKTTVDESAPSTDASVKLIKLNEQRPIWTRDPNELTKEEYVEFYQMASKTSDEPLAYSHFKAEGEVGFKSILYIPSKKAEDFANSQHAFSNVRLFLRRVLVKDEFKEGLLPGYLSFLIGVVDSDDLPINVSREMLQQSRIFDMIKRKLIRKALELIRTLMVEDQELRDKRKEEIAQGKTGDEITVDLEKNPSRYMKFWNLYNKNIKFGVVEDEGNRQRLAKLLRYRSNKCNLTDSSDLISLDQYMDRIKENQEYIYYHAGETLNQVRSSGFLEKLVELDYEVLYMVDPLDEHVLQYMGDYEGMKFMAVSKDNFKFAEKDQKAEKKKIKPAKVAYQPLKDFISEKLKDRVSKVKLSARLTRSPSVISAVEYGYSPHMELMTRAQMFEGNNEMRKMMMPKQKVMEINPFHPIMVKILDLVLENPESEEALKLVELVYDAALVSSGYFVEDSRAVSDRMNTFLAEFTKVDLSQQASVDDIRERLEKLNESDKGDVHETDEKEEL